MVHVPDGCTCSDEEQIRRTLDLMFTDPLAARLSNIARQEACGVHGRAARAAHASAGKCEAMILKSDPPEMALCSIRGTRDLILHGEHHRLCGTHLRAYSRMTKKRKADGISKADWWAVNVWWWR